MDISFADLALQFSVALIAIIIAVNSTGVVRTTISALFAIAVVALTVVMAILYFNLGSSPHNLREHLWIKRSRAAATRSTSPIRHSCQLRR